MCKNLLRNMTFTNYNYKLHPQSLHKHGGNYYLRLHFSPSSLRDRIFAPHTLYPQYNATSILLPVGIFLRSDAILGFTYPFPVQSSLFVFLFLGRMRLQRLLCLLVTIFLVLLLTYIPFVSVKKNCKKYL